MIKALALSPDNQVFRSWADPAPNCIHGVSVATYTDGEIAAVTIGLCVARFTNPAKLRELAAGLLATAERMEED
jgi:hypothetical protein